MLTHLVHIVAVKLNALLVQEDGRVPAGEKCRGGGWRGVAHILPMHDCMSRKSNSCAPSFPARSVELRRRTLTSAFMVGVCTSLLPSSRCQPALPQPGARNSAESRVLHLGEVSSTANGRAEALPLVFGAGLPRPPTKVVDDDHAGTWVKIVVGAGDRAFRGGVRQHNTSCTSSAPSAVAQPSPQSPSSHWSLKSTHKMCGRGAAASVPAAQTASTNAATAVSCIAVITEMKFAQLPFRGRTGLHWNLLAMALFVQGDGQVIRIKKRMHASARLSASC